MSLITRNAKEYRSMTAQLMSQFFLKLFVFYVILTISYLRVQTIETSSLPTNFSRPLFKQIEIFSILTVWLYISTVSTFLNIRARYLSASSGFRLLGEIPADAITNNNLLVHFSGHNNDLLVLKQCKGALHRIMTERCALGNYFPEGLGAQALSYM